MKKNIVISIISLLIIYLFSNCESQTRKDSEKRETVKDDSIKTEIQDKKEDKPEIFNCDYLGEKPPKEEPVKFAPGIVSTKADEYAFEISPSGNEMLFMRKSRIMLVTRNVDETWNKPKTKENLNIKQFKRKRNYYENFSLFTLLIINGLYSFCMQCTK